MVDMSDELHLATIKENNMSRLLKICSIFIGAYVVVSCAVLLDLLLAMMNIIEGNIFVILGAPFLPLSAFFLLLTIFITVVLLIKKQKKSIKLYGLYLLYFSVYFITILLLPRIFG